MMSCLMPYLLVMELLILTEDYLYVHLQVQGLDMARDLYLCI